MQRNLRALLRVARLQIGSILANFAVLLFRILEVIYQHIPTEVNYNIDNVGFTSSLINNIIRAIAHSINLLT